MLREKETAANRERLDRLRHPERYRNRPAPEASTQAEPATFEQRVTRRPPLIDKQRRLQLQLLDRPPRSLSAGLWLRTVLGGWLQQFGWAFFGFGMVFFWAFGMHAEVGWPLLAGETATVEAVVTGYRQTGASEGGSDSTPGTPVYATQYRFRLAGQEYAGESYATGDYHQQGHRVTVEYSVANPQRSRIRGMRSKTFGAMAMIVVIFPLLGLIFVIGGMRYGLRSVRLLRIGVVGFGRLVSKTATNTRINEQTVWRLEYEFATRSGQRVRASARSHVTELLEDEAEEPLFYNPDHPEHAVLLDAVPGGPEVSKGRLVLRTPASLLSILALPLLTVVGHGCYILFGLM